MDRLKTVLIIAGSDPSAGAGIQADLKTVSSLGIYGLTAITSITVQNTIGVKAVYPVNPVHFSEQLSAIGEDIKIDAVKIGMLYDQQIINIVADFLQKFELKNIILDPVFVSTSGRDLLQPDAVSLAVKKIFPLCRLVTPNIPEAELLSGMSIRSKKDVSFSSGVILESGVDNVLIKGGHADSGTCCDYLFDYHNKLTGVFCNERIDSPNTHGTGCTLSSAIAASVAAGLSVRDAVFHANKYLYHAIDENKEAILGRGIGPLKHDNSYSEVIRNVIADLSSSN